MESRILYDLIIPALLGLVCVFSGGNFFMFRRVLQANDEDHREFDSDLSNHDRRLTRAETKLETIDHEVHALRGLGGANGH